MSLHVANIDYDLTVAPPKRTDCSHCLIRIAADTGFQENGFALTSTGQIAPQLIAYVKTDDTASHDQMSSSEDALCVLATAFLKAAP
jgi:hypothetical protein